MKPMYDQSLAADLAALQPALSRHQIDLSPGGAPGHTGSLAEAVRRAEATLGPRLTGTMIGIVYLLRLGPPEAIDNFFTRTGLTSMLPTVYWRLPSAQNEAGMEPDYKQESIGPSLDRWADDGGMCHRATNDNEPINHAEQEDHS